MSFMFSVAHCERTMNKWLVLLLLLTVTLLQMIFFYKLNWTHQVIHLKLAQIQKTQTFFNKQKFRFYFVEIQFITKCTIYVFNMKVANKCSISLNWCSKIELMNNLIWKWENSFWTKNYENFLELFTKKKKSMQYLD